MCACACVCVDVCVHVHLPGYMKQLITSYIRYTALRFHYKALAAAIDGVGRHGLNNEVRYERRLRLCCVNHSFITV